jgi:hypothetical protein
MSVDIESGTELQAKRQQFSNSEETAIYEAVRKYLWKRGIRRGVLTLGQSVHSADRFAVVNFHGQKQPAVGKLTYNKKVDYTEYGASSVSLPDEFIALCLMLQP